MKENVLRMEKGTLIRWCPPMLVVCICFAIGIALQGRLSRYYGWGVFLCASGLLAFMIFRRNPNLMTVFLLCSIILTGAVYTHSVTRWPFSDINHYRPFYVGERLTVDGVVISEIAHRQTLQGNSQRFTLKVQGVQGSDGWTAHSGKILVNVYHDMQIEYGDRLRLLGKLHAPYEFGRSDKFSYRQYLNRRGIRFILSVKKIDSIEILGHGAANPIVDVALHIRHFFQKRLEGYFNSAEAGILVAMLLGDRQDFSPALWGIFQRTGTAHIIAISGLHVGVVAGVLILIIRLIPVAVGIRNIITIISLIFYAVLTGGQPSVIRAVMMACIFIFGLSLERESLGLNALALSAMALFLLDPMVLYDIGFQLSFMCVFFILSVLPITNDWLSDRSAVLGKKKENMLKSRGMVYRKCRVMAEAVRNFLVQSTVVSLSAWLGSAGLIVYYFEIVTPITVFANILVVPLSSAIIALGLGLMVVIPVCPWGAWVFVNCLKLLLNLMVFITAQIDRLPGASFSVKNITFWPIFIYYLVILIGLLLMRLRCSFDRNKEHHLQKMAE
jgi:competence protein ComEC